MIKICNKFHANRKKCVYIGQEPKSDTLEPRIHPNISGPRKFGTTRPEFIYEITKHPSSSHWSSESVIYGGSKIYSLALIVELLSFSVFSLSFSVSEKLEKLHDFRTLSILKDRKNCVFELVSPVFSVGTLRAGRENTLPAYQRQK